MKEKVAPDKDNLTFFTCTHAGYPKPGFQKALKKEKHLKRSLIKCNDELETLMAEKRFVEKNIS